MSVSVVSNRNAFATTKSAIAQHDRSSGLLLADSLSTASTRS